MSAATPTGRPARAGAAGKGKSAAGKTSAGKPANAPAPPPSTLTPPLPGALGEAIGGIPDFFIESFRVPPFLLPIYQAAGTAYDIPWQVLAAINEVETDYGRDLNVSSAGAEGWMQFLPSSWALYGVDATGSATRTPTTRPTRSSPPRATCGRRRGAAHPRAPCSPTTTPPRTSKR